MPVWKDDDETIWTPYTSLVEERDLVSDRVLRLTPGIYQAVVPKRYEIRVTVIGHRVFAAKIFSQDTEHGRLDWRKAYDELKMEQCTLPTSVVDRCLELMRQLGIVFGCFDFIVTPSGEYFFLEVNEMGQFLFVEHYAGLPLLDAFCNFLLQGSLDFTWDEQSVEVRYDSIEDIAKAKSETMRATHVRALERPEVENRERV